MKLESNTANNRTKFSSTVFDKENDESVFYTPMSHKTKTPIAASTPHLRRQTIASPLTSRNRPWKKKLNLISILILKLCHIFRKIIQPGTLAKICIITPTNSKGFVLCLFRSGGSMKTHQPINVWLSFFFKLKISFLKTSDSHLL